MRSIHSCWRSISCTSSRECKRAHQPSGRPHCRAAPIIRSASASLVRAASRPPLRSTAFPLLRHSEAICTSASGRLSKMTPTTPMGQLTRYRFKPGDSSLAYCTFPSGSGSRARDRSPSAMPAHLARVSLSRLNSGALSPFRRCGFHIGRIDGQQVVHMVFNSPRNRLQRLVARFQAGSRQRKRRFARAPRHALNRVRPRNPPLPIGIGTLYATALPLASACTLMRGRAIIASCGKDRERRFPPCRTSGGSSL